MRYPICYKKTGVKLYDVYILDELVGEVSKFTSGWLFLSFENPRYLSEQYAPTRDLAVVQWPGIAAYKDFV